MKTFSINYGVGKSKYVVSHHDGQKMHGDNSPFFDVSIFRNKKKMDSFVKQLKSEGFRQS